MLRFAGAIVALLATAGPGMATESCQWTEASAQVALANVTAEEAQQLALRAARARAVEMVAGVELQAETIIQNQVMAAQFLRSLTQGYVLQEEVRWEHQTWQRAPDTPPLTLYIARLKACVAQRAQERDPYFSVSATLNKSIFVHGEEATIRVRCTQSCYLTILNLSGRDRFEVMFPDQPRQVSRLNPAAEFVFPPKGVGLEITLLPGRSRDTEAFLVVATKGVFRLTAVTGKTRDIPFAEVSRALLELPASERSEAWLVYDIRAR